MEINETPATPHAQWAAIELERRARADQHGDFSLHELAPTALALWRNNAAYEAAIAAMTSDYPPSEIATWEVQRQEASAWSADNQSATPWIDAAATARGIDRLEYLQRTLGKAQAFAAASAWLTGRRQALDDLIKATPAEQLHTIVIDYTLPGAP